MHLPYASGLAPRLMPGEGRIMPERPLPLPSSQTPEAMVLIMIAVGALFRRAKHLIEYLFHLFKLSTINKKKPIAYPQRSPLTPVSLDPSFAFAEAGAAAEDVSLS